MPRAARQKDPAGQLIAGFWQALTARDSLACLLIGAVVLTLGGAGEVPYVNLRFG